MSHLAAAAHLREEVIGVSRAETGRLVVPDHPAFFAAVRGVMCDLDYVAALHAGWNGGRRDKIATKDKTVRFIREVVSVATGNDGYQRWAKHLYELYRTGLVHLRAPKVLRNDTQDPPMLAWFLMFDRSTWEPDLTRTNAGHLQLIPALAKQRTAYLPVSIKALFDDFIVAVQHFAEQLDAERENSGDELLSRWRQTADALCDPDPSNLHW